MFKAKVKMWYTWRRKAIVPEAGKKIRKHMYMEEKQTERIPGRMTEYIGRGNALR